MKYITTLFSFFLLIFHADAQNLGGRWAGEVTQEGKPGIFLYEINLTQTGETVSGTATSRKKEGGSEAAFEVGGVWDGSTLTLQEVRQTQPPNARWCLKHIRLQLADCEGVACLKGNWEAEGCTPGKMELSRDEESGMRDDAAGAASSLIPPPSSLTGRWFGRLSQSDREYGFYFEMDLKEDGTGVSKIYSDGEGGNATHRLNWTWDEPSGALRFEETGIEEKSVADWRWCIKSARLPLKKEANRLSLSGDWQGFIEGFTGETGTCASGDLYLEKPLFKKEELTQAPVYQQYVKQNGRTVQVQRLMEVQKKTVKIRVWDNGTVDGDILTLFLNGKIIVKNYRVTRQKHETIVTLDQPVNYLILHAINLGSISPNTVAVSVDDGVLEQVVIVSSNLKESGAIMMREFKVGEAKE